MNFPFFMSQFLKLKKHVSASAADLVINIPTNSILYVQKPVLTCHFSRCFRTGSSKVTNTEACVEEKGIAVGIFLSMMNEKNLVTSPWSR